jgi:hypothetical protein
MMNRITQTATYKTQIVGVVEADQPCDGGKWALLCEHFENGEWVNGGIIQDTNKQRLATWIHAPKRGAGYTTWCDACVEENEKVGV